MATALTLSPFLTIVTRTSCRPDSLQEAIRSVWGQQCWDLEVIFIVDKERRGLDWANRQFTANRHRVDGAYVMALDDDGILLQPKFVGALRRFVLEADQPDVVIVRSRAPANLEGDYHDLPPAEVWDIDWEAGERPAMWAGHAYNYIVEAHCWKELVGAYDRVPLGKTGGDWYFGTALMGLPFIRRLDAYSAKSVQRGRFPTGVRRYEDRCPPDWWETAVYLSGGLIEEVAPGDWRMPLFRKERQ